MRRAQLFHVDAFTKTVFRGNPAGVVLDADGMSAQQMQALARELKHSETAFVMAPQADDHDVAIRYFTPTTEVPVCGHATIAAHYARATALRLDSVSVRQRCGAGILHIEIVARDGDYRIIMGQGPIVFGPPLERALRADVARGLGLREQDLAAHLPVQIVSTGHSKVMVPLADGVVLDDITPDHAALTALSARLGCNGFFPFRVRQQAWETDGRMFAPAIGIAEDPVTGNANGPLGAYLVRHRLLDHDGRSLSFTGHQGRAIGRDGIVKVQVDIDAGEPCRVAIEGEAVILFSAPLLSLVPAHGTDHAQLRSSNT